MAHGRFSRKRAERQIDTAIDWGRYAELFDYDTESACLGLANVPVFRVVRLPGSHHFDGNYAAVGDTITRFIQEVVGRRRREHS